MHILYHAPPVLCTSCAVHILYHLPALLLILVWCPRGRVQHILYRQKEQFSDGVGYSWIDGLKAHAEKMVRS